MRHIILGNCPDFYFKEDQEEAGTDLVTQLGLSRSKSSRLEGAIKELE